MKLTIAGILLLTFNFCYSQCNICKEHNVDGGIIITQCPPTPINLSDKQFQPALSVVKVNGVIKLLLTIRFVKSSMEVNSELFIFLLNNKVVRLPLSRSGKAYLGNSEICHSHFVLTDEVISLLSTYKIKGIGFSFIDDIQRNFDAKINSDVLIKQFQCFISNH